MNEIIASIDILQGRCVRLLQGNFAHSTVYSSDTVGLAQSLEDAGIRKLHLVDLDGARAGKPKNLALLKEITARCALHVDFSGGVRNIEDIEAIFANGANQVALGSVAVTNRSQVFDWLKRFGAEKIILAFDIRDEKVAIKAWQEMSNIKLFELIEFYLEAGLRFLICTDIAKDGTLTGPNLELYAGLRRRFPELNIIASGGVSCLEDIKRLRQLNLYGVIVGRAWLEGKISLAGMGALQC